MTKKAIVIGAGFSGLSAACELAKNGMEVTVFEKNESAGGRASVFSEDGFTFDMGPSWYWMPDIFEWFFDQYGNEVQDFYDLVRLDPGYRIFFSKEEIIDIPASREKLSALFESIEPGASVHLDKFLKDAEIKYEISMRDFIFKPCNSVFEFADQRILKNIFRMNLFSSLGKEVDHKFKDERLRKILKFPVYFLGALPSNTPALYSILNYADLVLGTWYPMGGMYKIVEAMQKTAERMGVQFKFDSPVEEIVTQNGIAEGIISKDQLILSDYVIASADYQHTEKTMLPEKEKNYTDAYWEKKIFAPSCLIYFLGVHGKVSNLLHHNLFFDQSFEVFADEIYTTPRWPSNPLFYVSAPSKTDGTVAPEGDENLFILIPVAPGLTDSNEIREKYFSLVMNRLEEFTGENIRNRINVKKCFAPADFTRRYNAYKGNAYGLANTLMQTAIFKPAMRNKNVRNLFYAGQLTVPGPGVPPAIISGHIAAQEVIKYAKKGKRIEQSEKKLV